MNAAAAPSSSVLIRAAWACLVLGWVALLVPMPAVRLYAGLPLVVLGTLLAAVALSRSGRRALPPLVAALLVSPLAFFLGGVLMARSPAFAGGDGAGGIEGGRPGDAATAATGSGLPGNGPATLPAAAADAAARTAITAYELSSAYDADAAAADRQFKGQRLLVTGMVAPGDPAGPLLLAAGDFPAVNVEGVAAAARAALREGQQISLACKGAGVVGGVPAVDGCTMQ